MRLLSKTSAAFAVFLSLAAPVQGQENSSAYDFEYIRDASPWLGSRNAAGLSAMTLKRATIAELNFTKDNGGFIDNAGSEDCFKAGAMTESYLKISESVAFYGKLSYSYFKGQDMGGSILMDPAYNPVNFYESDLSTTGIKNRELYHLIGGISYSFKSSGWAIGAKFDYESGDQAKLKDPRFLNVWMDLGASGGFRYDNGKNFSIGMNLEYRRTMESLLGKIYGVSGKQYFNLIDYGGFYGNRELFDGTDSMVSSGNTCPMFNSFIGASVQIESGKSVKIFHELTYLKRSGYYGNKGSSKIMFTEHGGNIFKYKGELRAGNDAVRHHAGICFSYQTLANFKNVYRLNTQVGANTVVEYLSQNEVLDRSDINAGVHYTAFIDVENYRPKWEVGAKADFDSRQSLATIYPYYRSTSSSNLAAEIYGKRNIVSGKNMFTLYAAGAYMTGFGIPKDDGILASSSSDAPKSFDVYLYKEFEYRTAQRAGAELTFRYTRLFSHMVGAFIQLSDRYTTLLAEPEYMSNGHRNTFNLTIGCTF